MRTKLFAASLALAAMLVCGSSLRADRPRPGPVPVPGRPRPQPITRRSSTLNITYAPLQNGCRVIALGAGGAVPFADGSTLDPGDVIVKVGDRFCGLGTDLEALIALAYQNGNTQIQVRDVNTGQVFSFDLP
jgi:hypothetical protein